MKKQAVVYAGPDEMAARDFAFHTKDAEWGITVGSAYAFNGSGGEDRAYIMADVPRWHRERIQAAYGDCVLVDAPKVIIAPILAETVGAARADSHLRTIYARGRGRPRVSA